MFGSGVSPRGIPAQERGLPCRRDTQAAQGLESTEPFPECLSSRQAVSDNQTNLAVGEGARQAPRPPNGSLAPGEGAMTMQELGIAAEPWALQQRTPSTPLCGMF
jgi:hypothetical protein